MKQFNLEAAKAGKPVCTRDGKPARIVCFDKKGSTYPLVALIYNGKKEETYSFTEEGKWDISSASHNDLFMLSEKHKGWVNLYRKDDDTKKIGNLYASEQQAINNACQTRVATIKIEWDE